VENAAKNQASGVAQELARLDRAIAQARVTRRAHKYFP
jgi:hypothetical protein